MYATYCAAIREQTIFINLINKKMKKNSQQWNSQLRLDFIYIEAGILLLQLSTIN